MSRNAHNKNDITNGMMIACLYTTQTRLDRIEARLQKFEAEMASVNQQEANMRGAQQYEEDLREAHREAVEALWNLVKAGDLPLPASYK